MDFAASIRVFPGPCGNHNWVIILLKRKQHPTELRLPEPILLPLQVKPGSGLGLGADEIVRRPQEPTIS